jgi:signal transduction protein with GAF and PtsI domain
MHVDLASLKQQFIALRELLDERAEFVDSRNTRLETSLQSAMHEMKSVEKRLLNEIHKTNANVDALLAMTTKWKGGLLVVVGFGGLLAWAVDIWKSFK